jgi:LysM repeat protein
MVNPEDERRTNWGPRLLAPLAFFAAVTVLALLVQSSLSSADSPGAITVTSTSVATSPTATGTTTAGKPGRRKSYVIKEGDTLEAIAERFDTTVDDLLTLNPGIEANALEPGTKIRIQ